MLGRHSVMGWIGAYEFSAMGRSARMTFALRHRHTEAIVGVLIPARAFYLGRNMIKDFASQFFVGETRAFPIVLAFEARM